jgi:hypothetical protein
MKNFINIHIYNFSKFKNISLNNQFNKFPKFNFANQPQTNKKPNANAAPGNNTNIQEEELKPEPFTPFEKMTDKQISDLLEKNKRDAYYYFGNDKQRLSEKKYNMMEFYSKKLRRDYIRYGEVSSHKFIIKVKRMRTKEDTIEKLDKNRECAVLIQGREEFPDIDVVIDKHLLVKLIE